MIINYKISNYQKVESAIKRCYTISSSELFFGIFTFNQLDPGHFLCMKSNLFQSTQMSKVLHLLNWIMCLHFEQYCLSN